MRQFTRGERAKLSELAAINHIWEIGVSIDAPFFVVDFCCLGLDASGEVVDERYLISYNQPEAPQNAIRLDNTSNNGAIFTFNLGRLPQQVRRLVFTATLHEPSLPGGLLGAAFSWFGGVNADIGEGRLTLSTPAIDTGIFSFAGEDFAGESTLILGELYWRDEWRFVAAGQPLKGELNTFLRSLTDGPTPVPMRPSMPQRPVSPLSAPPRQPRAQTLLAPKVPALAPLTAAPSAPIAVSAPARLPVAPLPVAPLESPRAPAQPVAQSLVSPSNPASPVIASTVLPGALPFPQSLPPGGKLQDLIDVAAPGSTLTLMRDEYEGPITIDKTLILEGRDSALWSRIGPVVTIAAPDVVLHNLDIEITVSPAAPGETSANETGANETSVNETGANETNVALKIQNQAPHLQLDNVRVRGRISGLGAEDGDWELPALLDLGQFAPRAANDFCFSLRVPTPVQLLSPVEGVSLLPAELGAGQHQVTLQVRDVTPETLIVGFIEVRSASLTRRIPLSGSAVAGVAAKLAVKL
ncbi:Stress response protein SCP2 [Abditibacterium utsteinense]|uniref:Stress response protein SCP2 n=1 Tax=Abditibacterium utsteinense TaxID=1960156 RepID=A0A2S8SS68_9BACT|nr:TerD family protein [Abditibacterium utsteinense]PQV63579.1 Stress response protein SCP2 [Abditibacterium utsteinense]